MPLKYRNRTDIIANVLETANGKLVIWSNILYSVFLSHRQLKGYVALLIQNDLLEYDSDNKTYKTTEKGLKLINLYGQLKEYVKH